MVGEFKGRRFEIGSVFVAKQIKAFNQDLGKGEQFAFELYAKTPTFDAREGELMYVTIFHGTQKQVKKFVENLNAA